MQNIVHSCFLVFLRYPGVQVDVLTTDRGKQTYELNKNVRWANVYDPDDDWPEPAEYTDMIGLLKVCTIVPLKFSTFIFQLSDGLN